MSIVKWTNKNTGVTYVYESVSYWDKEKQQPRNKRKLIGKIDPNTGDIVPTKPRSSGKKSTISDSSDTQELVARCQDYENQINELNLLISKQKEEILSLKKEKDSLITEISQLLDRYKQ